MKRRDKYLVQVYGETFAGIWYDKGTRRVVFGGPARHKTTLLEIRDAVREVMHRTKFDERRTARARIITTVDGVREGTWEEIKQLLGRRGWTLAGVERFRRLFW